MKKTALLSSVSLSVLLLIAVPLQVSASTNTHVSVSNNGDGAKTNVKVNTNTGESTKCVNGNCETTSNGNSTTTVCENGDCKTIEGDVNYQSDNGNTKIEVNTNTGSVEKKDEVKKIEPTNTPKPTVVKDVQGISDDYVISKDEIKNRVEDEVKKAAEGFNLLSVLNDVIQDLIGSIFGNQAKI